MKFMPKKISTLYKHTTKYLTGWNLHIMPVFWTSFMPEGHLFCFSPGRGNSLQCQPAILLLCKPYHDTFCPLCQLDLSIFTSARILFNSYTCSSNGTWQYDRLIQNRLFNAILNSFNPIDMTNKKLHVCLPLRFKTPRPTCHLPIEFIILLLKQLQVGLMYINWGCMYNN